LHKGKKGISYLEKMVDGESNLGKQFICSNLIYSKSAIQALKNLQDHVEKYKIDKEDADKVRVVFFSHSLPKLILRCT